MKPYKTYNNIDLPWLDAIPAHWNLVGLNLLFADNKVKNEGMIENNILSLSYGNIVKRKGEENFGLIPASYETYQVINPGYIVLRLTDMQNDHTSLRVGLVKERGIITSAYTGLIPKQNVNSTYFYYLLHTLDLVKYIYVLGGGVRQSSDYNEIKKLKLPFPPVEEQTAIANYLDAQKEKINLFIVQKQKLIALLKLQRQAIINKAVIKGIDENVKLKPSSIDFIDEIPVHWEVKKIKYLLAEKNIRSETGDEELLALSKYKGMVPKKELEERLGGAESLIGYKKVTVDDLVVNKMQAANGLIAVSKVTGITSPEYSVYRVKNNQLLIDYYGYLLSQPQFLAIYKANAKGVMEGYIRLYTEDLFDIRAFIPPIKEQEQIVEYIKEETKKIDEVIIRTEKEIQLIKEYRQSIVSEVVTGKIKINANGK